MIKTIVTAAILDEAGRVLLSKRKDSTRYGGLWEFPGGKVEADETCEAAIIRELAEELDIDVQAACLAPLSFVTETTEAQEFVILLYVIRIWQGTPKALDVADFCWVSPMKLRDYPMPPANQHLVAMLRDVL